MTLSDILHSWKLAHKETSFGPPVAEEDLQRAEATIGRRLTPGMRGLYALADGAYLFGGSLQLYSLLPRERGFDLSTTSTRLREWKWQVPDEALVFGDNGGDESIGAWMVTTRNPSFPEPIIVIGEVFGRPECLAIVGTSLERFLLSHTAYYLQLYGAPASALDAIEVPAKLRRDDLDDDHFAEIYAWADPGLPDMNPDPYSRGLALHEVSSLFGAAG